MLELGPGDSIASGIIANCYGASRSFLVDKGNDAIASFEKYSLLLEFLDDKFKGLNLRGRNITLENMISEWNIEYLVGGLESLKEIPDASVDYLWSQSVLEHIRKGNLVSTLKSFAEL